ncbi:hypothetical protein PoB_002509300 [Plakobranchus ocellatus]|uniref:Uncharacterized protein n=1 Tax=Plakobranchus ocellatus TaxID=259542 RepID=A0AAV3ZVW5_9GAST|nr:hypothetical protein PoB_002509300 [Plakobranchus ocellatus]
MIASPQQDDLRLSSLPSGRAPVAGLEPATVGSLQISGRTKDEELNALSKCLKKLRTLFWSPSSSQRTKTRRGDYHHAWCSELNLPDGLDGDFRIIFGS